MRGARPLASTPRGLGCALCAAPLGGQLRRRTVHAAPRAQQHTTRHTLRASNE